MYSLNKTKWKRLKRQGIKVIIKINIKNLWYFIKLLSNKCTHPPGGSCLNCVDAGKKEDKQEKQECTT